MQEIWFVWGAALSGSTLFNALLQTQPGIYGLGEASHWFDEKPRAYCHRCGCKSDACESSNLYHNPEFYSELRAKYPDAKVFVSTNKHPSLDFEKMPPPPLDWRWRFILLSKTPHAFAHSALRRPLGRVVTENDVNERMDVWFKLSRVLVFWLSVIGERYQKPVRQEDVLTVTYDNMVSDLEGTVFRVCRAFDAEFQSGAGSRLWERPKSCQLNGNIAVRSQFIEPSFFDGTRDPKYAGKYKQLFHDQVWREDLGLVRAALKYYCKLDKKAASCELLAMGYPHGVQPFMRELTQLLEKV